MFRTASFLSIAVSVVTLGCTTAPMSYSAAAPAGVTPDLMNGLLPLRFIGGPTTAPITEHDLMTRLYRYADDSMQGRRAGTIGNTKATAYIAAEFRRLGLRPAGDSGGYLQDIHLKTSKEPVYNVVAIIPGSDPVLRHQYVAIGAHNDHIGIRRGPAVDHDSARAAAIAIARIESLVPDMGLAERTALARTAVQQNNPATRASLDSARTARQQQVDKFYSPVFAALLDTLRRRNPVPRRDSVGNGADDDGSGTVALLELAEAIAPLKLKRSILLVSHTAEESGLLGSKYFTEHPTVSLDSIVAMINLDMIGRGTREDLPQGGPRHLDIVGSGRLSTQLDQIIRRANTQQSEPFVLDYRYDAEGHPERIYCRSDHWSYARHGIPVAFFFTGLHVDYHKVTDEPQYIDYPKLTRVTRFMFTIATDVANRPQRPIVDKPLEQSCK